MDLSNAKIKNFWQRTLAALRPIFVLFKKTPVSQAEIDRKLVYDLSPRKIPSGGQLRQLKHFLNPRESLIVRVCLLIIFLNLVYLAAVYVKNHLQSFPATGGEYIEGTVGYPQTINPLYAVNHDIDSDLTRLIYSSLFQCDGNGQLRSDLADTVAVSPDGTQYTVKIKNNVKWQDGEKLTADDVIFTWDLIQNPDYRSPLQNSLANITVEKIDATTIRFTLPAPYSPFPSLLTFGILPQHLWQNIGPNAAALSDLNLKPVGSGPFEFQSLVKNTDGELKDYKLKANPAYYGQPPYLQTIDFKFFPDYQEAIKALNDNQITGLSYLPFGLRDNLLARNSLDIHELLQPQLVALFFNSAKNKSLADKATRVALAEALDKDQIIKNVFGGIYPRVDGPILPNNFAYDDGITKYNYNPTAAAAALKSQPPSLTITAVDAGSNAAVVEQVKNYWEQAGVKVAVRMVAGDQIASLIRNRDFEVLLYGESLGGDPDLYAFWDSQEIGATGLNLANYNNSSVDKLLVEARATTSPAQRLADYKKFQEIITNDLPAIFLYSPTYTYAQASDLRGFAGTAIVDPADRFSTVNAWYLKTSSRLIW